MPADDEPISDDELPGLFRALLAPGEHRRLALAVSGGVDSLMLMHLVARWLQTPTGLEWLLPGPMDPGYYAWTGFAPQPRPIGLPGRRPAFKDEPSWMAADGGAEASQSAMGHPPVVVLTVDHGLRPESAEEAAFVASEARRVGFPHQTLVWARGTGPTGPPLKLQERARAARHELMGDVIEAELWDLWLRGRLSEPPLGEGVAARRLIVTAHHREDLIETFFLRLRRGSGLNGLASIRTMTGLQRRPTPARPYPAPLGLFRPLLDVPKSRLVATATAMGLTWRDDPSNRDVRFERVALRQALPGIGALGLSAPALHLSIRRLQRAQEVVELEARRQMEGWASRPRLVDRHGGLFATIDLRDVSSEAASLVTDANADVQLRLLADTIAAFGGRVAHGCELAQLETLRRHLLQCARADGRGALTDTATTARTLAGCRIDYHRGARQGLGEARVRIWRESGRRPLPELTLAPGDGGWWDDRFALSVAPDAARPVTVRALGDAGWAFLKARVPSLALWRGIPPGAPATLPAVWDGPTLLGVPFLEQLPRTVPAWLKREIDHEMDAWNGLGGSLYRARFAPVAGGGNWK